MTRVSLDLGLSFRTVIVENNRVLVDEKSFYLDEVDPGSEEKIVLCETNECYVVEIRDEWYYKLKAVGIDLPPTIEINGIHMHKVVGVDPWSDAKNKVRSIGVKRGDVVLDTCMGLGYTAINSVLRGAAMVYTFEIDPNVFWIVERNPWSRGLSRSEIRVFHGDVTELIKLIDANMFDKIIHDPPRFTSTTGSLYSLNFYLELYRVLKPCGKLFHYTGEALSGRLLRGISDRLRKAGFTKLRFDKDVDGFIALKPCVE